MNEQALKDALNAILEIAEGIRGGDLPDDLADQIDRIVAIARYKYDVRSISEKDTDRAKQEQEHT
jgi:hypothetical protein